MVPSQDRYGSVAAGQFRPRTGDVVEFDFCRELWIKVIPVEDLTERGGPLMYLREQQIALIDAGLDPDGRRAAARLLRRSAVRASSPRA